MTPIVIDVAVRALLIAAGTALALWALRIRVAAVRHAAWTAVVIAMLVLPIWSIAGPKVPLRLLPPASERAAPAPDHARVGVSLDAGDSTPSEATSAVAPGVGDFGRLSSWETVLVSTYALGVGLLLGRLVIGTVQANRLRRSAVIETGGATSPRCATPITVGWFKPMLILPSGWQRWPAAKLEAVLTHEGEHARRRDPLVQWLALLNRAVFWFHPLSWWLERRLSTLAEEACDAAVLAAGHAPQDYAGYLLDMARSLTREGRRVNAVGMAMPGSSLPRRLQRILEGLPQTPVTRACVTSTVALCAMSSALFATGTLAPRSAPTSRFEPGRLAAAGSAGTDAQGVTANAAATPKFEVASIKPCTSAEPLPGAKRSGLPNGGLSPGLMHVECSPLVGTNGLIRRAYGTFASGHHKAFLQPDGLPVEGGPAWIRTERYTIEAKADGTPSIEMMHGPMLQALLEDRFHLTLRRETRDIPVYELRVARGGSKLRPFDGSCKPVDFTKGNIPAQLEAEGSCPIAMRNNRIDAPGQTIGDFIAFVLTLLDRPVVDKTALTGRFDIHLDLPPDDGAGVADLTSTLAMVVQRQLGLTIAPAKGPGQFLVIEHVERPKSNDFAAVSAKR